PTPAPHLSTQPLPSPVADLLRVCTSRRPLPQRRLFSAPLPNFGHGRARQSASALHPVTKPSPQRSSPAESCVRRQLPPSSSSHCQTCSLLSRHHPTSTTLVTRNREDRRR